MHAFYGLCCLLVFWRFSSTNHLAGLWTGLLSLSAACLLFLSAAWQLGTADQWADLIPVSGVANPFAIIAALVLNAAIAIGPAGNAIVWGAVGLACGYAVWRGHWIKAVAFAQWSR